VLYDQRNVEPVLVILQKASSEDIVTLRLTIGPFLRESPLKK
jgi:hypothetical protein